MSFGLFISNFRPLWMDERGVKCKGSVKLLYPEKPSPGVSLAKYICNGRWDEFGNVIEPPCVFRDICLQHAIDHHEAYGVWGGTSERDRRKIQRARNKFANSRIYNLEDVRFPNLLIVKSRRISPKKRRRHAA